MKIGGVIPHDEIGTDPGAIEAYAQGAEELGVHHLMIYDHVMGVDRDGPGDFVGPYDKDVAFHEPFVLYGFLAAVTERVELITSVLILPQRQAVLVAKQAAEVAVLSGDRLKLGIGVGVNPVEYDIEFHRFENASILPRPSKPIPVLFGGSAPAVIDRCARLGDGWIPLGRPNQKSVDRIAEIERIRESRGLTMEGFGATHLAIATHNAGETDIDGHLGRIARYREAVETLAAD